MGFFLRMSRLKKTALALLAVGALAYAAAGGVFYFLQDTLIYYPSTYPAGELERRAEAAGFEPWKNSRGEQIGWQSRDGDTANVLLACHGQGGNALDCAFLRTYTADRGGNWKTFLLEYPGNGNRPGPPSEKSLTAATVEAIDLLTTHGRRIWLLGHSLGSGVACAALSERADKISGLILLTPFNSLAATVSHHYPLFPVSLFLKSRFDSEKNLVTYPGPVAFFLCEKDTTIPISLARKLHDGFPGPKKLWIEPHADHDATTLLHEQWPALTAWLLASP